MSDHMVSEISPIFTVSSLTTTGTHNVLVAPRPRSGEAETDPLIKTNEADDVAIPMEMTSVLPHLLIHFTK